MSHLKKIAGKLGSFSGKFSPKKDLVRRRMLFETLERRLLLSADPVMASQNLQEQDNIITDPVPAIVEPDSQSLESEANSADTQKTEAAEVSEDDEGRVIDDEAGSSQSHDEVPLQTAEADTQDTSDSDNISDTSREEVGETQEAAGDRENSTDTVPADTTISPQVYHLLTQTSGKQLIFIDPSVPEYETLLDGFDAKISDVDMDVEKETQTSLENDGFSDINLIQNQDTTEQSEDSETSISIVAEEEDSLSDMEASLRGGDENPQESSYEFVILDSDRDGLEQITETLEQYQGISAVHIISHGAVGTLRLGNSIINRDKLEEYSSRLRAWRNAIKEGGDVLLYGCNIADGDLGIGFVEDLSVYTGADVAASTDDTGSTELGGDWELEYSTGPIETPVLFQGSTLEGYGYLLEDIVGTDDDDTLFGNAGQDDSISGGTGDDTYKFEDGWGNDSVLENADEGVDTLDFSAVTTDLTFTLHDDGTVSVTDGANKVDNAANVEKIIGGSGQDTFILENKATWSGTIDGGGGTNVLDLSAVEENLQFTIRNDGTVSVEGMPDLWGMEDIIPGEALDAMVDRISIENAEDITDLIGAKGDNTFVFEDNAVLAGTITGGDGGKNTLDYSAYKADVTVDLLYGTATGTAGISNIQKVKAGEGKLNIIGGTGDEEEISFASRVSGVVSDLATYAGLEAIEGTDNNDELYGNSGNNIIRGLKGDDRLEGGAGDDTYMFSNDWGADTVFETLDGGHDVLDFSMVTSNLTFTIHTDGTVSVTDGENILSRVANIEGLVDGQGDDTFAFEDGAVFNGSIGASNEFFGLLGLTAGGGTNTLDLSAYTSNLEVDLGFEIPYLGFSLPAFANYWDSSSGKFEPLAVSINNIQRVTGGSGSDRICGSGDADVLYGGEGDDIIYGRDSVDIIDGGAGNDQINGGVEDEIINALIAWNATDLEETFGLPLITHLLEGGTLEDYLTNLFSGDKDIASYASATDGVTVNLSIDGQQNTISAGLDTLKNIQVIIGSNYDDILTGSGLADELRGGAGNDTLYGYGGPDILLGGAGDDILDGGADADIASYAYAAGAVTVDLRIAGAQDTEGDGTDTLSNIEGLTGSAYDDVLYGDAGANTFSGLAGDDTFHGYAGNDVFKGDTGSDTVSFADATDWVVVNLWNPLPQSTTGGDWDMFESVENLVGSQYDDILIGGSLANVLDGGAGNDLLSGGPNGDTYVLGDDWETDDIQDGLDDLAAALDAHPQAGVLGDVISFIAGVIDTVDVIGITDSAADAIAGQAPDTLYLGDITEDITVTIHVSGNLSVVEDSNTVSDITGMEYIVGGSADNTFVFENNAEFAGSIEGGVGGINTLDYTAYTTGITVNMDTADESTPAGATGTLGIANIHNVIGGSGDDLIIGSAGANSLFGGAGHDTLRGGAGNDLLKGGVGDDVLAGGDDFDTVSYENAISGVTVELGQTDAQDTVGMGIDTLSDVEGIIGSDYADILTGSEVPNLIMGGAGADEISGGAGDDILLGESGNDTISGGTGDDVIEGGEGGDLLDGGEGNDTVSYINAAAGVTVDISNSTPQDIFGDATETDTLAGFENILGSPYNDSLTGTDEANIIIGGEGDDTLSGGKGDDILRGEAGNDTLYGGEGDDILSGGLGDDLINGFTLGGDPADDTGIDTASYAEAESGVTVDLRITTPQFTGASLGTLSLDFDHDETGTVPDSITRSMGNWTDEGFVAGQTITVANTASNNGTYTIDSIQANKLNLGEDLIMDEADVEDATITATGASLGTLSLDFDHDETGTVPDSITRSMGSWTDEGFTAGQTIAVSGTTSNNTNYEIASISTDGKTLYLVEDTVVDETGIEGATIIDSRALGSDTLVNVESLLGSEYDDTLIGDDEANILIGSGGDDFLMGGSGDDTISGGEGIDFVSYAGASNGVTVNLSITWDQDTGQGMETLLGLEGVIGSDHDDTLIGDENANTLIGGSGNDTLEGWEGDDILEGGIGDDRLDGGLGDDAASYANAAAGGITVDLSNPLNNRGEASGDTFVAIENLIGSAGDDDLTGNNQANTIEGGGGADTLYGGEGHDFLVGGEGDDSLYGEIGDDVLEGGAGRDILDGGLGADTASYENAPDGLEVNLGTPGGNTGEAAGDSFYDIQNLAGSAGDDILIGDMNDNTLYGLEGDDTLIGGQGNDRLLGGSGFDTLDGEAGDDVLIGGEDADTLHGGSGSDTVSYENADTGVVASLATLSGADGEAAGDIYTGVENLRGSEYDDELVGDAENNTIEGLDGDDVLEGGGGDDLLDGGLGGDFASYAGAISGVTVDLTISTAQMTGETTGNDTLKSIENLAGSTHADTLIGDAEDNVLMGDAGDDILYGNEGSDILLGELGMDTLYGGAGEDLLSGDKGADIFYGGDDIDTVTYIGAGAGVTVDLSTNSAAGDEAEGDALFEIENIIGSAYNDSLKGDALANALIGGSGDDLIDGLAGDDFLEGGQGSDTITGGEGSDTASYQGDPEGVNVDLGGDAMDGFGTKDTLTTIENLLGSSQNDILVGDEAENILTGGLGDDILTGGGGDDSLAGGEGSDSLVGGTGGDTYLFEEDWGADTITETDDGSVNIVDFSEAYSNLSFTIHEDGHISATDSMNELNDVFHVGHLIGGRGDDVFILEQGSSLQPFIDGGPGAVDEEGLGGSDTLDYSGYTAGITVDLSSSSNPVGTNGITNIHNIIGTAYDDTLTGNDENNILIGGEGADFLYGGAGEDLLMGGAGMDTLEGGAGDDYLEGGADGDAFYGGTIAGGDDGNDTVSYETFQVKSDGIGVTANLADAVYSGGDAEGDSLDGIENLIGSMGADTLVGDSGSNLIYGGDGDDLLIGGGGDDSLEGGVGWDTVSYEDAAQGVHVDLGDLDGPNAFIGDPVSPTSSDTLIEVEDLIGSAYDDVLIGDIFANIIRGGAGADEIHGMDGDDRLYGGEGDDTLYGGEDSDILIGGAGADFLDGYEKDGDPARQVGIDTASYATYVNEVGETGVTVDLSLALQAGTGDEAGDQLYNIENLTGSDYDDTLVGDAGDNVLTGGAGDDTLAGGDGFDMASYATYVNAVDETGVTVDLSETGQQDTVGAGLDTLSGIEGLIGSDYSDTLTGNEYINILQGGFGNDILDGGAEDDFLEGGSGDDLLKDSGGNDLLDGGFGTDTVSYEDAGDSVTVDLKFMGRYQETGGAGDDYLLNIENLTGSGYDDTLIGDSKDNVLSGGGGIDTLVGGLGADTLIGGAGGDFIYGHFRDNTDKAEDIDIDASSYEGSNAAVTIDLSTGSYSGGHADGDQLFNIEKVIGSDHDDHLIGDAGDNFLHGGAGVDTLEGGSGDDYLEGGADGDYLYGGTIASGDDGTDTASYESSPAGVSIDLSTGTYKYGHAAGDSLAGIEIIVGSDHDDTLKGDIGDNALFGGAGADTFEWSGGQDLLDGGAGDDTFPDYTLYQSSAAPGGIWQHDLEPIIVDATTYSDTLIWMQGDIIYSSASSITIGEGIELRSETGDIVLKAYAYQEPNLLNLLPVYTANTSTAAVTISDNTILTAENVYIGASASTDRFLSYDYYTAGGSDHASGASIATATGTMSFDPGDPVEARPPKIIWNDAGADFEAAGFAAGQTIKVSGSKLNNEQYTVQSVSGNSLVLSATVPAQPVGSDLLYEETETLAVLIEEIDTGARDSGPLAVLDQFGQQIGELDQLGKNDMQSDLYKYDFAQTMMTTVLPLINRVLSIGASKVFGSGPVPIDLNAAPPFQWLTSTAVSTVSVGSTTITATGDVVIESSAQSSSGMMGSPTLAGIPISVGGVYVKSEADAQANITGNAEINAGGSFIMNADVVNSISEKLSITSKKLITLPKKVKARKQTDPFTGKETTFQKEQSANKTVLDRFKLMFAMGWGEAVSTSKAIVGDGVVITAANVDVGSTNDNSYDVSVSAAPLAAAMPKPGRIKSGAAPNAPTKPTEYNFSVEKDAVMTVVVTPGAQDPAPRQNLLSSWPTKPTSKAVQNKPMRLKVELIGPDGNPVKDKTTGQPIIVQSPVPSPPPYNGQQRARVPKLSIRYTAAVAGTYTIRVSSLDNKTGTFQITIDQMGVGDAAYAKQEAFGSATAIAVSRTESTSEAKLGGTITVNADTDPNTPNNVFVHADSIIGDDDPDPLGMPDKNNISAIALLPKQRTPLYGSEEKITQKGTPAKNNGDSLGRMWRSFSNTGAKPTQMRNAADKKEAPTKGPNLAGAVAYLESLNQATATISDDAVITVDGGDVTVDSYVEENIKVNVTAHVKKPSETVSGAIAFFWGDYTNRADAFIGDGATVDASGVTSVKSEAKIPNQIIVDDEWEAFLKTGEDFLFDWSIPEPDTASGGSSSSTGIAAPVTNAITGAGNKVTGYIQGVNTMLAEKTSAETMLLNYFPSFLTTANFIPTKIATTYVSASAKTKTDDKYYDYQRKQFEENKAKAEEGDPIKQKEYTGKASSWSFAFTGSVDIFMIDNQANAWIGEEARINTDQAITSTDQDVIVSADAWVETINMVGIPAPSVTQLLLGRRTILPPAQPPVNRRMSGAAPAGTTYSDVDSNGNATTRRTNRMRNTIQALPLIGPVATIGYQIKDLKDYGPGRTAKQDIFARLQNQLLFPNNSQGSGLGVNFNHTGYTNAAKAYIDDGAIVVSQNDVTVKAKTHNLLLDLTAAGGKSEGWFGISGSGNWNKIDNTSMAHIGDDVVIQAKKNVLVDADTDTVLVSFNAAMTQGANLGVGITATVNNVKNTIESFIGDGEGDTAGLTFTDDQLTFTPGATSTLTRTDGGSWLDDGLSKGQWIRVSNLDDPANDGVYQIDGITDEALTLTPGIKSPGSTGGTGVIVERIGSVQAETGKVDVLAENKETLVTTSISMSPPLLESKKAKDAGGEEETPPSGTEQNKDNKTKIADKKTGGTKTGFADPGMVAINGTFSYVNTDNRTLARIDGGFYLDTGQDLTIDALDNTSGVNVALAFVYAGDIGIAGNVAINHVSRDTRAEIGDAENDPNGEVFITSAGNVNLKAENGGWIVSASGAGVLQKASKEEDAQEKKKEDKVQDDKGVMMSGVASQITGADKSKQKKEDEKKKNEWVGKLPEIGLPAMCLSMISVITPWQGSTMHGFSKVITWTSSP
jgi:Ca2+-binding RTX toxin-like protein